MRFDLSSLQNVHKFSSIHVEKVAHVDLCKLTCTRLSSIFLTVCGAPVSVSGGERVYLRSSPQHMNGFGFGYIVHGELLFNFQ